MTQVHPASACGVKGQSFLLVRYELAGAAHATTQNALINFQQFPYLRLRHLLTQKVLEKKNVNIRIPNSK